MMSTPIRRKHERRKGTAAVELAVCLPLLVLLFLIALDFGRVFYGTQTVSQCSRGGVFYESFKQDTLAKSELPYTDYQSAAAADGTNLKSMNATNDITVSTGTTANGREMVGVSTVHRFKTITNLLPSDLNVSRSVKMQVVPLVPNFN